MAALDGGLKTLSADGLQKIREGLTTLEEVRQILGAEFFDSQIR